MAEGKRFAQDFTRIDEVEANDAILVQDGDDGVVKFANPSQVLSYVSANGGFATQAQLEQQYDTLDDKIALKQDLLVSGSNVRTVAGKSIVGYGNVVLDKSDVGLGNVDNTSDANKPISNATQRALNTLTTAVDKRVESVTFEQYKAEQEKDLDGKADKATTLAGYNITDAYTKGEVDAIADAKANTDDYYPQMSVGFADNLVGRGEATAEEISFRPTAGALSIESGTARVKTVKGNSVVWNQWVKNVLHSATTIGWKGLGGTVSIDDDLISFESVTEETSSTIALEYRFDSTAISSHKYLVFGYYKTIYDTTNTKLQIYPLSEPPITVQSLTEADKWYFIPYVFNTVGNSPAARIRIYTVESNIVQARDVRLFDLTQMFGAGNEPTTVEEFYERMPLNVDMNAYNEGEIIDNHCNGIKTVGFNQWDEQWEVGEIGGGTGLNVPSATDIRSKGYIKVLPNTQYYIRMNDGGKCTVVYYDANYNYIGWAIWGGSSNKSFTSPVNAAYLRFSTFAGYGTTYNNDICINLSHTGYKNGTYEPYNTFTRDLGVIQKYFQNGMRKAGDVCDEIRFNSTTQKWEAVQNVDVRDYVEADSTDASVTTDGTHTNYALATPIITEITEDDINFDYVVEDFGTEEALAEVASAPFAADIVYQFNAVDRIRQNTLTIEELQQLVQQLQSQVTTLHNASNEAVGE